MREAWKKLQSSGLPSSLIGIGWGPVVVVRLDWRV